MNFKEYKIDSNIKNIGSISIATDNNNNIWFTDGHPQENSVYIYHNTELIKTYKRTDCGTNFGKYAKLFKKDDVVSGKIKDATYQAYMTGVKKGSLGTLNVEIKSFVDSNTMRKKFKKEILNILKSSKDERTKLNSKLNGKTNGGKRKKNER